MLLVATFGAGVAAGVAADRLLLRPGAGGSSRPPAEGYQEDDGEKDEKDDDTVIERFSDELGLTSAQEARIDTILKHYRHRMKELRRKVRPRYDALVDSARRRIEAVLDSAQVHTYRKLLERKTDRGDHGERRDGGEQENGRDRTGAGDREGRR